MDYDESLKLENQLCFPLYAASRMVTKCYQPVLDDLGITYPQYLVLMVLWENDGVNLSEISTKLKLQSNTVTPLLKRMEEVGLIKRVRSDQDQRSITISLEDMGKDMKSKAVLLQDRLSSHIGITMDEAQQLHTLLNKVIANIDL